MMRDILLYGQDMRTAKGPGGSAYDGPGGSGGAELPIPEGLAVQVPYSPLDTRTTHKVLKDPTSIELINIIREMRPTVVPAARRADGRQRRRGPVQSSRVGGPCTGSLRPSWISRTISSIP